MGTVTATFWSRPFEDPESPLLSVELAGIRDLGADVDGWGLLVIEEAFDVFPWGASAGEEWAGIRPLSVAALTAITPPGRALTLVQSLGCRESSAVGLSRAWREVRQCTPDAVEVHALELRQADRFYLVVATTVTASAISAGVESLIQDSDRGAGASPRRFLLASDETVARSVPSRLRDLYEIAWGPTAHRLNLAALYRSTSDFGASVWSLDGDSDIPFRAMWGFIPKALLPSLTASLPPLLMR